jgi:hypothetical protein
VPRQEYALASDPRPTPYSDCGSLDERRVVTGAEGGGTTGPMSPSGASSMSTITDAWWLGPRPLRVALDAFYHPFA